MKWGKIPSQMRSPAKRERVLSSLPHDDVAAGVAAHGGDGHGTTSEILGEWFCLVFTSEKPTGFHKGAWTFCRAVGIDRENMLLADDEPAIAVGGEVSTFPFCREGRRDQRPHTFCNFVYPREGSASDHFPEGFLAVTFTGDNGCKSEGSTKAATRSETAPEKTAAGLSDHISGWIPIRGDSGTVFCEEERGKHLLVVTFAYSEHDGKLALRRPYSR